jgi:phosphoribosylamine---glycine ligase
MRVAVVGSGGREHTLVWKIAQSPMVKKIYALPGNGGISDMAECVAIDPEDISGVVSFCKETKIDLVMIGPEAPLSKGLAETLRGHGIPAVGPDAKCAMLESSKVWAKEFMIKHGIPTAGHRTVKDKKTLMMAVDEFGIPVVIKMDGLCAGKGVFICNNMEDVEAAVESIYGVATGEKVVVEEFLKGDEASYMIFTDGESYVPLVTSRDHKKIFDGDKGPNTGGMGAVSPAPLDEGIDEKIKSSVIEPLLKALKNEKMRYNGVIYAGLMICPGNDIRVLEFNARFGDPETQVILTRMESDIMDVLVPLGTISKLPLNYKIKWNDGVSCCVVVAQKGYPGNYDKGVHMPNVKNVKAGKNEYVFHAGTVKKNDEYYTNGGRILGVTAVGTTLEEARKKAYALADKVAWPTCYYRKDIGVWR